MPSHRAILKPGKEKAVLKKHPWIFSGALEPLPPIEPGELLPVFNSTGQFLAQAYFHPQNALAGRILSFTDAPIAQVLSQRIAQALHLRRQLFDLSQTNCYRLINAEGDGIPGLIVDVYGPVVVLQVHTWGIERLREKIIALLLTTLSPKAIYEKSSSFARQQEGLNEREGFVFGSHADEILVRENGISFFVSLAQGQKTGFFLDQREMRQALCPYAKGKKILNCFSYTGGFSLYALQAGAEHVVSVDSSVDALALAARHTTLNGYAPTRHETVHADVFSFLRKAPSVYDLIILDPPAFAKRQADVISACAGYKEINRLACEKLPAEGFLLTSSCSHFIDDKLFQNVVFQAAHDAGREAQILFRHHHAPDHPISLCHPEGGYLKSLFLRLL